jgi:hypothetical protein
VTVHLGLDELLRNGDLDLLEQLLDDLVASLRALAEDLRLAELLTQVGLELVDRVELAGDLGEVVVGGGKLALLDGDDGDADEGVLAGVVAAEQRRLERGALTRGERVERLVDAVDELTGAELVGDPLRGVDLVAVDRGDEIDLREVAGLGRAVDRDERAETGRAGSAARPRPPRRSPRRRRQSA